MASTVDDRLLRGSDFSVGKSVQTAYGAINSNPAFQPVRRSSGKPKTTVGYTQDDQVTTENQGQQNIQDTVEYSMELQASFSKQSVNWLIEAIHGVEVAYSNTATTFEATASGFVLPSATYSALSVGDAFWISGFAEDTIDGFYIIASKDGSNTVTTTIAPADTEATGASVTLISRKTVNGLSPTYNTLQERVTDTDASGDITYTTFYDAVIDTQSIEIGETGIVTSTANFFAERKLDVETAVSGQTYSAALTDRSVSAVQDVDGWYVDGVSATCDQKSMTLEIANGYAGDDAAGCVRQYARGQFSVSGSAAMRARISDPIAWRTYYEQGTRKSMGVLISHPGGGNTFIVMPQIVVTEHDQANGNNDVSNHEISFAAEGHSTLGYTVAVFRDWS
jgi:hypothetical protein